MNSCLVTRLRGVVDNPNLPVIETMQQFTLDAIAASGNTLMTEAQKYALNHFFFQIGAIEETGIFAKTKYLFLPMICGSVKAKTLVNYIDNTTFALSSDVESAIAYDENGCVYNTGSEELVQELVESASFDCSDLYYAVGIHEMPSTGSVGAFIMRDDGVRKYGCSQSSDKYRVLINGLQLQYAKSNVTSPKGFVSTCYNDVYTGAAADSSQNYTYDATSGTEHIPTNPHSERIQFAAVPVGILAWGSHLTETEANTLANAIRELVSNF